MSTPLTTSALRTILETRGEVCESTAPEVLVKLCRKLETELAAEREKTARLIALFSSGGDSRRQAIPALLAARRL